MKRRRAWRGQWPRKSSFASFWLIKNVSLKGTMGMNAVNVIRPAKQFSIETAAATG